MQYVWVPVRGFLGQSRHELRVDGSTANNWRIAKQTELPLELFVWDQHTTERTMLCTLGVALITIRLAFGTSAELNVQGFSIPVSRRDGRGPGV